MGRRSRRAKEEPPSKPRYESADEVFLQVNHWGRYQWYLAMLYGFHFTIVSINDGFMAFQEPPLFRCNDTGPGASAYNHNNSFVKPILKNCDLYYNCSKKNFEYKSSFYSIVEQYNLVCNRAFFKNLITSLQFAGVCVGAVASGPVVDFFGRKWTFLVVVIAEMAAGSVVAAAQTWEVQAALRFVIGCCAGADMNAGWVFLGEFTGNRYRFLFRAIAGLIPSLSFPIVGYLTRDWRTFVLWGNLQCLPLLLLIPLTTFESPRWLIQRGRLDEACLVFEKVARWNGRPDFRITPEELPMPPERKLEPFWRLFSNWRLIKYSICGILTWFVAATINFGMVFDIGGLPFDIYKSMFITNIASFCFELPIALVDTYRPKWINRRLVLLIMLSLCAVINGVIGFLFFAKLQDDDSMGWLFILLYTAAQLLINVVFDTAYVYSIELFPTLLRSQAGAMCSASARLGAIIAPQVNYTTNLCESCAGIPYLTFAAVGIMGVVVDFFLLPNTKDKALLENYDDEMQELDEAKGGGGLGVAFSAAKDTASVYPELPEPRKEAKY